MIRQNKKIQYILTSDWHLREDTPTAYVGDFEKDQWEAVDFVSDLQQKYNCPVLHAGDLFHHWKPSPYLLSKTIEHLPKRFYTIYGNHDLPQHNMELKNKCGIYTLEQAKILSTECPLNDVIDFCSWNEIPYPVEPYSHLLWHVFTYKGAEPWPGCTSPTAKRLLKNNPGYDLIVTGDNHQTFTETYEGRLLVNPGSLTRQSAAQIDFHPSVFLYDGYTNSVKQVYLPFKENVISREHITKTIERDNRLEAFISKLNTDWQAELSFEENLEIFKQQNNIREEIMDIVYKAIES